MVTLAAILGQVISATELGDWGVLRSLSDDVLDKLCFKD